MHDHFHAEDLDKDAVYKCKIIYISYIDTDNHL